ncbi:signal peptidase I SipW [Oceanobacillus sp. Castelsardo]|uniref:signal peptidase I SipW n=1 Tax=Oceanobacillus sp. Castelsardo TaxID=1851204 RepID=UPI000839653E|nr:signal peptidase I [Oceanobacillus sp. Castelsardo]
MKKKALFKWVNRIISSVLMIVLFAVAALVVINKASGGEPEILGYQLKTVLSGSMEPEIQTGSVIAVTPVEGDERKELGNGDVITFMESDDMLVTHRVIDVNNSGDNVFYTTKGDNNNAPDTNPVLAENVVAVYQGFTIPYLGYISSFAQSPNGSIAFLIIPGFLMLGYSILIIWRALRELDDHKKTPTDATNS